MDIFEMAGAQFQSWSTAQIGIFTILLVALAIGLVYSVRQKRLHISQAIAAWILVLFLGIILGATTFTRTPLQGRIVKLIPFWSWYTGIVLNDTLLLEQNVLNCLMLAPMGFLLPWIADRKVKLRYAFLAGVAVAVVIEGCQLVFKLGWFEWDDMIHNGISCFLGCSVGNWGKKLDNDKRV